MAGYKKETPQWLKEELIAIYTDSNLSLDQREAQMSKVYNETLNKNTSSRTLVRLTQKWKAKKQKDAVMKESITIDGHTLHGLTLQGTVDEDGEIEKVTQFWAKTKPDVEVWQSKILDAIENIEPLKIVKPKLSETIETMLVIPFFDMHFGISDMEHYNQIQLDTIELITSKKRKKILIPISQDLFHNNDMRGNTANLTPIEKVDMNKAWEDAMQFWRPIIEIAYENCEELEIAHSKANHDEAAGFFFVKALEMLYSETDIIFDTSQDDIKARLFGKVLVAFSHGDKGKKRSAKSIDWRGIVMSLFPKLFLTSIVRELLLGHYHTEIVFEDGYGMTIRRTSTANKTDDWHLESGFVGNHKRFILIEYSKKQTKCIYYV